MDQQTRTALKQDKFVDTTNQGLEWASEHRRTVIVNGGIALAVIVVLVLAGVIYSSRSDAASSAFGAAMQIYQTPLSQPGQEVPEGMKTYATAADRAKAAEAAFADVADHYGLTPAGRNARYFVGVTQIEAGQTQQAEQTLKKVADGWDSDLAGLAKFALAQLYRDSGRNDEAIALYDQLIKKPTMTIPSGLAQLQKADVLQAEGKTEEARKLLADLKDKDPKGVAGEEAAAKLNPQPQAQ